MVYGGVFILDLFPHEVTGREEGERVGEGVRCGEALVPVTSLGRIRGLFRSGIVHDTGLTVEPS